MKANTIAKINNVSILVVNEGEKFIPIKPICEALGIAEEPQIKKIKEDDILASTATLKVVVAADGKEREMFSIPYKFVFGWLFTINPKNVNPDAQENVKQYRLKCYEILFMHFTETSEFLEQKQTAINKQLDTVDEISTQFKTAKTRLTEEKEKLNKIRKQSFEEWKQAGNQLTIKFD